MSVQSKAYDAIILGGGIAGLSAAIAFQSNSNFKKVLVLDKPEKGQASGASAGILDPLFGLDEKNQMSPLAMESFQYMLQWIPRLKSETKVPIQISKTGLLLIAKNQRQFKRLQQLKKQSQKLGLKFEEYSSPNILSQWGMVQASTKSALWFEQMGALDPKSYLKALKKKFVTMQGTFQTVAGKPSVKVGSGSTHGVRIEGKNYHSEIVVNATGCWMPPIYKGKKATASIPIRGQILILKGNLNLQTIAQDTDGTYIVPQSRNEWLLGSTVENVGFRSGVTRIGLEDLLKRGCEIIPELRGCRVQKSWAGLRPMLKDGMPVIGETETKGLYVLGGYYRSGVLVGAYVGQNLAKGIVSGKMPSILKPFSPLRFQKS